MDRRTFLLGSAAATTAAALSTWFAAHAEPPVSGKKPPPDPLDGKPASKHLKTAYRAARDTGRPLLVLVHSEDHGKASESGHLLGTAINNASQALLADLVICEVVCATTSDLAVLVPQIKGQTEPMLFLVEVSDGSTTIHTLDIETKDLPSDQPKWGSGKSHQEMLAAMEKAVKARNARVSKALRDTLAGTWKKIDWRAKQNLKAIGNARWTSIRGALSKGAKVTDADVLAAAALIRREAESNKKDRAHLLGVLSDVGKRTLKEKPPGGAKWARSSGCGVTIEGEKPAGPGVACGMGFCSPLSERFLMYYAKAS